MKKLFFLLATLVMTLNMSSQTTVILNSVPDNTDNSNVYIVGNFNDWNPEDSKYMLTKNSESKLYITLDLEKNTKVEFKFTKGSWAAVEKDINGNDISNRQLSIGTNDTVYLKVENWAKVFNTSTANENVTILTDSFYIPQFNRYRTIRLFLPKDYATSDKNYPVIYMHDAQNLFDDSTSYAGEWHVDESLNKLFVEGFPEVIVVGIDHGESKRIEELTPWPNIIYGGGQGDLYVKFIIETLKPYIDKNYRTLPDRENTAIWGSSLGGLLSLYAVLQYPETFSKAGVFSPSLWYNKKVYKLAKKAEGKYDVKIYILAGGREGNGSAIPTCEKLISKFNSSGIDSKSIMFKPVAEGEHNEGFWSEEFPDAYKWLFE